MEGVRLKLGEKVFDYKIDLSEHNLRSAFGKGEVGNVFSKVWRRHVAHYDRAERADFLISPDEAWLVGAFIGSLLQAEDLSRHGSHVKIHEGREINVFKDPVTGNEFCPFGSSGLVGNDVLEQFVNLEVIVTIIVLNLGEDDLTVVIAGASHGIVSAEFLRSEVGGHQGVIRPHDDVEVFFYVADAAIVPLRAAVSRRWRYWLSERWCE